MDDTEILATGQTADIVALITDLFAANDTLRDVFILCEQTPRHVIDVDDDVERLNLLRFVRLRNLDDDKIKRIIGTSTSGRIFCPDFELRWEQVRDNYQVVYLGKPLTLPELNEDEKGKRMLAKLRKADEPRGYYLFGKVIKQEDLKKMEIEEEAAKHRSRYYAEARIPRLLDYPELPEAGEKKPRARLKVYEYTNEIGRVTMFRFAGLEAKE